MGGRGHLSAAEAQASPGLKAHFDQADADADGALTGEEYRALLAKRENGMKTDLAKREIGMTTEPGKTPKN